MNSSDPFHDVDAGEVGITRAMDLKVDSHVMSKPAPELPDTDPKPRPHFRIDTEIISKPAPDPEPKAIGKAHTRFDMEVMNPTRGPKKSKVPPSIGSMYP